MDNNYILEDKKQIFFYYRFCKSMDNIEAIKKSKIEELIIGEVEMNNFIEKIRNRIEFNRKFGWKKKLF